MKTNDQKLKAIAAAIGISSIGCMTSMTAVADNFTAAATVNAAITLTETTALDFGTFVATSNCNLSDTNICSDSSLDTAGAGAAAGSAAAGDSASLVVTVAGVATANNGSDATMTHLGGASAAELTITGAAGFTTINVTSTMSSHSGTANAATSDMLHSVGGTSVPKFLLTDLQFDISNGLVAADGTSASDEDSGQTDSSGGMTIFVGGTLYTTAHSSGEKLTYTDGSFSGTYDVTVSY